MANLVLTPVNIGKMAILILGVIILGVGVHSHFQSIWTKPINKFLFDDPTNGFGDLKMYKICEFKGYDPDHRDRACPAISMEKFYVAMIIICFILSLIIFAVGFVVDLESHPLKLVDLGYHGASAFLLFIAAILYIVSAVQIDKFFSLTSIQKNEAKLAGIDFRNSEKIAAGVLTMFQALLYGGVAVLIAKR